MKAMLIPALAAFLLAGCATSRMNDTDRLALYQSHAGEPVNQVRYFDPIGWNRVDDQHVVLDMRPNESWLLTLSGPCLDWSHGSPFLRVSTLNGMMSRFDKVIVPGSQISCQIREIRPLDIKAVRAAQKQLEAASQASGT